MSPTVLSLMILILAYIAFVDLGTHRIPNPLVTTLAITGLTNGFLSGSYTGLSKNMFGLFLGILFFYPFYYVNIMGAGDVKLLGAVGSLYGPLFLLNSFIVASIIGGMMAIFILFQKKVLKKTLLNICLFFILVSTRAPLAKESKCLFMSNAHIPYGFAISLGALLTLFFKPLGV